MGLVVINIVTTSNNPKHSAPQAVAVASAAVAPEVDAKQEARYKIAAGALIVLKRAARDPDSLVVESVFTNEDGSLGCIAYRAKNGFGGMNRTVLAWNDKGFHESDNVALGICRGTKVDMTYARQAM